ncbi:hypothetical protein Bpfe_001326 [Biomphalaria pfeifferi]|uniref:Uncharacterized protein n=1 Tax=Biomphalaria pfeifferi TaxID=112525 RepID=A0AAD8CBB0_BIOPF|nr:hypothetical protein Bpfe_001326 [Biomphalaria pfeifferi]
MGNRNLERQDIYDDDEDWWIEFRAVDSVRAQHTETTVLLTPPVNEKIFHQMFNLTQPHTKWTIQSTRHIRTRNQPLIEDPHQQEKRRNLFGKRTIS